MSEKALAKKETIDLVEARIKQFQQEGDLHLPADYSASNALKAAWLIIQETKDRNQQAALSVCTRESVANAMLDMVVQGLNPIKKQGYFIVYGDKLTFQRSYFGTQHLCKQVAKAKDIYAQVVYEGDDFEYEIFKGKKRIRKHEQKLENINNDKIKAAYCVIEFDDNPDNNFTDMMTYEQIKKSWAKSKVYTGKDGSTHKDYAEEMAKKTVINRTCKNIINSSNDSYLMMAAMNRNEEIAAEETAAKQIDENANVETIDITSDAEVFQDTEPEKDKESKPKQDIQPETESTTSKKEQQKPHEAVAGPGF